MQPQLPVEPTIQDAWMQAFANATRGIREAPQRLDSFARQRLGPGTYSDINRNVEDIFNAPSPIGWEDDAVKALMPLLSIGSPRARELYKKLLGFFPVGNTKVRRLELEGTPGFLSSHESRGGIFTQPLSGINPIRAEDLVADIGKGNRNLKEIKGYVNLENPIVVPKYSGGGLVSNLPLKAFGQGGSPDKIKAAEIWAENIKNRFDPRKVSATGWEGPEMTTKDYIRAKLARQLGFDAVIPVRMDGHKVLGGPGITEMMLLPTSKRKDINIRELLP